MSDALLPCPFCGDPMKFGETTFAHAERGNGCPLEEYGWQLDGQHIAAWNTRAPDARIAALEAGLRPCVKIIADLMVESGRSVEWGEEDAFRMGEWFDDYDHEALRVARALLDGGKP